MKGEISVEYPFIIFMVGFFSTLFFLYSIGMPIFEVAGIGSLPISPTHWYQYPGYALGTLAFFFKMLITPTVPIELRFMSVLLFTPFSILMAWVIIKMVIPLIQSLIGIIP